MDVKGLTICAVLKPYETAKIVDTLRNLLNNDATKLAQHTRVDERTTDEYLLGGWKWNTGKYPVNRSLRDLVDTLVKVSHI